MNKPINYFILIIIIFAPMLLFSQNMKVSKDVLKINNNDIAKIIRKDNIYTLTSLDNTKSYQFVETENILVNKNRLVTYIIIDLKSNKQNSLVTDYSKDFISPHESFYRNFSKNPIIIFSERGFDTDKVDSLIATTNSITPEQYIKSKNDSITNVLETAKAKAEQNMVRIEYDGKIFHHVNGEKIQIGKVEKVKTDIPNSYNLNFYKLNDKKFDLVGYYSTQGHLKTNLLGNPKELRLNDELIVIDDKVYKFPYISDSNSLPLSKDQTAYQLYAIIYNQIF